MWWFAGRARPSYIGAMRYLALWLLIAASLAACGGNVPIGPVDHSCAVNPSRGQGGSGCERA